MLTRIDFGLALGATKAFGRMMDTGGFAKKDRITHRFEITTLDRKSTRLNSSHIQKSRMPSSA